MSEFSWRDRNVLITGATGLLGSWLTESLIDRGAEVTCLVRDWVPASRLVELRAMDRANLVRGELEDVGLLTRAVNEYEIDTVFHLGAQTIVGTAKRSALSTFEANVRGTWNLLEACTTCSGMVERVIVASSDKAYGEHETLPYTEDAPLQGRYPYDASKSCTDLISLSYYHSFDVPVAVTRCGNLFGGGDLNFNRLIPGTIRSILRGEDPVIRSDGHYIRDYFYVRDAVESYITLAEAIPADGITGEAFNFGNEEPLSVLEIVDRILAYMGAESLTPQVMGEASHEIRAQYLNCDKAKDRLDWAPNWSFEDALAETVTWYEQWLARRS